MHCLTQGPCELSPKRIKVDHLNMYYAVNFGYYYLLCYYLVVLRNLKVLNINLV